MAGHCLGASVTLSEAGKDRTGPSPANQTGGVREVAGSHSCRHGSGWACSSFALMAQGGHVP
jgi:hypothetical protein